VCVAILNYLTQYFQQMLFCLPEDRPATFQKRLDVAHILTRRFWQVDSYFIYRHFIANVVTTSELKH
jgi:hypothetical protein